MAVIVKYVVERNGEEKMTFTSKAEADAYDKMLDMADELFELLGKSDLVEDESKQEELAMYLAKNKEEVLYALGAKRKPAPKKAKNLEAVEDAEEDEEPFFAIGKSLALPSFSHRASAPFLPALTGRFLFSFCFFLSFSKRGWINLVGSLG